MTITQDRLKELLHYDPETGVFTHLVTRGRVAAGSKAGHVDHHIGGYIKIGLDGHGYRAHRLAWLYMQGCWPLQVDHINRVRTDNKFSNLREVSSLENSHNRNAHANNRSGVRGVHWSKAARKWAAKIVTNGKHTWLGLFDSIETASLHRRYAELQRPIHTEKDSFE